MYLLPDVKGSRECDDASKYPSMDFQQETIHQIAHWEEVTPPHHCKIMSQMVVHCIWLAQYRF